MLGLVVLAAILQELREEFKECDNCPAIFDAEYNGHLGGVWEDHNGREHEEPTLCPACLEELTDNGRSMA